MCVPFDSGPPKNLSDCMAVYAELRRQGFGGRSRTVAFCKLGNVRIGEPGRVVHRSHDTGGSHAPYRCRSPGVFKPYGPYAGVRIEAHQLHFSKGEVFLLEPEHMDKTASLSRWLGAAVVAAASVPGSCWTSRVRFLGDSLRTRFR